MMEIVKEMKEMKETKEILEELKSGPMNWWFGLCIYKQLEPTAKRLEDLDEFLDELNQIN